MVVAQELKSEQLRRFVDPTVLGIGTTENLEPLEGIVGQGRAVSALRFGLGIQERGFNIYVAGPPGIGKMTAVQSFLREMARNRRVPWDWCYVNNFDDPYQPKACRLPAGRGREFQQDMGGLIEHVRVELPKAFESDEYSAKRDEIMRALNAEREAVQDRVNQRAADGGFVIQATPIGIAIVPVSEGRALTDVEVAALPAQEREELQRRRAALQEELSAAFKEIRDLERPAQQKLRELDRDAALYVVGGIIDDLYEKYSQMPDIVDYLNAVQHDIVEGIETFKSPPPPPQGQHGAPPQGPGAQELPFRKYQVNVFVDNGRQQGAPVVVELNPSYSNLFGRIEKEPQFGALYTDFTMIKPGSLDRANGGYLVLPGEELLRTPFSWDSLKRALHSREVQIEELGERMGYVATRSLRPQPIPLEVKVVLVGRPLLYYLLHSYDEEFAELFKVKADFDTRMAWSDENVKDFLSFICTFCNTENLCHLDGSAVAKVLEHAARLAEDQEKLSTHFGALGDIVREAHYWATQEGSTHITAIHVRKALDEKVYRSNLVQERVQEMIARGTLLLDTDGQAVGQVNGLSVVGLGDYAFGRASRITASVGPGRQGILDIEREVQMGGPIHSKGVLILSGYLAQRYAQDKPLSMAARLVFEQSYEGIEGDSASSTELYTILSALSDLPVRQGVAITGSVNQHGEVQAIGGVNEKIEGFYDVCRTRGLTGEQGVLIPQSNVRHLMLREDVVEAVKEGRFHIWTAKTIDEGIELLTGVPAGERGANGRFPEGTVNHRVDQRLREFAQYLLQYPEAGGAEPSTARSAVQRGGSQEKD